MQYNIIGIHITNGSLSFLIIIIVILILLFSGESKSNDMLNKHKVLFLTVERLR